MKFNYLAILAVSAVPNFGLTILNESFEVPLINPQGYPYVSGTVIPGWTVIDDMRGQHPYLVNESSLASYGIEFFGQQALVLNEGSGIETTVPLISGETYTFSIWGYGNLALPLHIDVGTHHVDLNFGHWNSGGLQERSFSFTANTTDETAVLRIFNSSYGFDYRQRVIDNISLTTTSPTILSSVNVPDGGATVLLLGLSAFGMLIARSKRNIRTSTVVTANPEAITRPIVPANG